VLVRAGRRALPLRPRRVDLVSPSKAVDALFERKAGSGRLSGEIVRRNEL